MNRLEEIFKRLNAAVPQIYKQCAHPQAVWFEEHWRPLLDRRNADIACLLELVKVYESALKFYAEHESIIKEAYHSNDEGQITCVHTFINHRALEALTQGRKIKGEE